MQRGARNTDGPRLRGASGVNVFKSLLGGTPFIWGNGRDGCGPSVLGVTPPRGEDACDRKPQVSPAEMSEGARADSRSERDAD